MFSSTRHRLSPKKGIVSQKLQINPYTNILTNTFLLNFRHNVVVFERDYTNLLPDKVHFADIVIDDKHGIALHMLQKLTEDWQVEQLMRRLVSLTLQLSFCWIILYSLQPEG